MDCNGPLRIRGFERLAYGLISLDSHATVRTPAGFGARREPFPD